MAKHWGGHLLSCQALGQSHQPPYKLSPAERAAVTATVEELKAKRFVCESCSPYGAPVLFVAKKDGSLCMCVDYSGLNKQTVSNKYPLPRIDEMLDRLQGAKVFSSLDLASGYHQLKLQDSDVPKTAFCTPNGLYEFLVLPFGLTNAPAVFQNAMDSIFRDFSAFVCVYMDDLLIFSKCHAEHMEHLRTVLGLLRKHKLYVKPKKCDWLKSELAFLGHLVGADGIKVDPCKIEVVRDFPAPRNLRELQQFLGLTNYFRRFVQGYSARALPLVRLTRKNAPFVWDELCQASFQGLKAYLMEAPVLAMPDMAKPWELVSDACGFAIGAVLLQEGRPVGFYARSLDKAEKNYSATERELLGCHDALKHWRCFLEGVPASMLTVVTDHNPLVHLQTQKDLSRRVARWAEFFQRFTGGKKVQVTSADCAATPCMQDKLGCKSRLVLGRVEPLSAQQMQQHIRHACSVMGDISLGDRVFTVVVQYAPKARLLASSVTALAAAAPSKEEVELRGILQGHSDVLTAELPAGVPPERPSTGEVIPELPGAQPVCQPRYRLRLAERAAVTATVEELKAKRFVRESRSPYGTPVLFVAKKDGSTHVRGLSRAEQTDGKQQIPSALHR